MLDWIMKNKEWVFSGIGVAALSVIIGCLRSKQGRGEINIGSRNSAKGDQNINIGNSVHQSGIGSSDNDGRDKNPEG